MEDDGAMEEQRRRMARLEGSNTTMSDEHYSIMVVYLAHALKEQGYRDIYLREEFSDDPSVSMISDVTNIL